MFREKTQITAEMKIEMHIILHKIAVELLL